MGVGSRHSYRSHHLHSVRCKNWSLWTARAPARAGLALGVLRHLRAQARLSRSQLGCEFRTKVVSLEDLANLDLRLLAGAERAGAALDPFDRLFLRLDLKQPVAGDQLLRLGEGSVDHSPLVARELDPRALGARLQAFAGEHHASFDELVVVFAHRREQLLA